MVSNSYWVFNSEDFQKLLRGLSSWEINLDCFYVSSDQPFKMNFRNTITNTIEEVIFPNYDQSIRAIRHVKLPSAYAVPTDKTLLIKVST